MGLQCKLPKSVQEDILNLKNKTLERLAATVIAGSSDHTTTASTLSKGFTSTKLILFLLTFFGLLALIIWLTSPSSSQEEEEGQEESRPVQRVMFSSSSFEDEDRLMEMMAGQQPSLLTSYQQQQQQQQQRGNSGNSSMVRRRSDRRGQQGKYQIDTIYESLAEVYEEKRSLTTSQSDPSVRETKEMLIRQTREELIRTIQQQQQLKQKQHQAAEKDTSPTGDMVDKILDDLILDDMETYAYNKDDRKPFYKQDSINNKTDSSTGSQNSLLSLYNVRHVNAIEDRFRNLDEVSSAIKDAGLEKGQLIFGIDFTISNLENGARTFGGRSLHHYEEGLKNPYQKVIEIMGKTLEVFDLDGRIPAFGFGDAETKDRKVFSFTPSGYCVGFQDVLDKYNDILKTITLSGPTNFAPLIKQAIKIVKETRQYHILVIVADGQVTNERQTRDAIVEASKHALSIIMVGVGDGPWDTMNEFDDSLPKRQFDNFQFVNYHEICEHCPENPDEAFALNALMEIPDQFKAIKELKLLDKLNK